MTKQYLIRTLKDDILTRKYVNKERRCNVNHVLDDLHECKNLKMPFYVKDEKGNIHYLNTDFIIGISDMKLGAVK